MSLPTTYINEIILRLFYEAL